MKKILLLLFFTYSLSSAFSQSSTELFRDFQNYQQDPDQQKTAAYVAGQLLERIHRDFVSGQAVDLFMLVQVGNFYFDSGNISEGTTVHRRWKQYAFRLLPENAPLPNDPYLLLQHLRFLKAANDLETAEPYAQALESLLETQPDSSLQAAFIYLALGNYYCLQGEKDRALPVYEQFQQWVQQNGGGYFGSCVLDLEGMELVNTLELSNAVYSNDLEWVQDLLSTGAIQVDCDVIKGFYALRLAARNENYPMIYALLEKGADVNIPLDDGNLLHYAVRHQDISLARKLLDAGINIYLLDNAGNTAKFLAEKNEQYEISSMIAEYRYQENNLAIQLGHRNVIRHFAVSHNGQYLASCEMKRTFIKLWDLRSRKEFKSINLGSEPTRLAFTSDDQKILIATADCALFSYAIETGTVERISDNTHAAIEVKPGQLGNRRETNYPLAYCEPREWVAVYGFPSFFSSAYVDILDLKSGQKIARINTDAKTFEKLTFSPDGRFLIGISKEGEIHLFDVQKGIILEKKKWAEGGFWMEIDAAFSPDGNYIAIGGAGNKLCLLDATDLSMVFEKVEVDSADYSKSDSWVTTDKKGLGYFKDREILSVSFWNDTTVITAGTDGNIRFWTVPSGKMVRKIKASPITIYHCVRDPDSRTLIYSTNQYMSYLDIAAEKPFFLQDGFVLSSLGFELEKPYKLYFGYGKYVKMFDLATGTLTQICQTPAPDEVVYEVQPIPGSSHLLICSYRPDDEIKLGEMVPGPDPKHISIPHKYESKSLASRYGMRMQNIPPEKREDTSGPGRGTVFLYDRETHKILWEDKLDGVRFISSCEVSPDQERVVLLKNGAEILLYDLADGEKRSYWSAYRINAVDFFQNSSTLINLEDEEVTTISVSDDLPREMYYDSTSILFFLAYGHGNRGGMAISPSGKYTAYCRYEVSMPTEVQVYDAAEKSEFFLNFDGANVLSFSPADTILAGGNPFGSVCLMDVKNKRPLAIVRELEEEIQRLTFDSTGHLLFVNTESTLLVYDVSDPAFPRLKAYIFRKGDQFLIALPNGYYFSDKGFKSPLAFRKNNRAYPFEQFDLVYNVPSKVIAAFTSEEDPVIGRYETLYAKRLQKMGFSGGLIDSALTAPDIRILSEDLPISTDDRQLVFDVWVRDTVHTLDRINVFVNDVPVFGTAGIGVQDKKIHELERQLELTLSQGLNKIQVSALNTGGAESLKETVFIRYQGPETLPDLYLITLGVSDYGRPNLNLRYADKDARDVTDLFRSVAERYRSIYTDTLYNRDLTKGKLAALKEQLNKSRVDDVVILFYAGHGIMDENFNYYLATADTDFKAPADKAIAYDELEELLDGIPARQKLLMIDACFSGEIDEDAIQLVKSDKAKKGKVNFRWLGDQVVEEEGEGLNVLQEVKELFNDIRRGSGATAIASASGAEFAIEGEDWKNGVFTYCFLSGLKEMEADLDGDGKIWVSELHQYLAQKVPELTEGNQQPNFRIENISNDWVIWEKADAGE